MPETKEKQFFDVDAASLSMTPEQFSAAYESAVAGGAEIYASPITFKRLYGKDAGAKMEKFLTRKNHKIVAKRGISPKDIDRQHEEYLKAGYNLEYDVSELSDDPSEVGRNFQQMLGNGYGARMDLDQIKQAYGPDWTKAANAALGSGVNLYERMKFEDAAKLVPSAEMVAPNAKPASAHGKETGLPGPDEMVAAHPVKNPERMLYVGVNILDASQGRGTARLYFSSKLAKEREQEWSEITGKQSDVFTLPAKLFPDDAKVKVGAAGVGRDKWIEMDNRDMPPEMRPWEQAKHRFTIDGRSRQSKEGQGQLDWNSEEGQKNIQAAMDSTKTNVVDRFFIMSAAPLKALEVARDTLDLISRSAKYDREALKLLDEQAQKNGTIKMYRDLGATGLAFVERFSRSVRDIGQMFLDLGHPEQVRQIHDAVMRYAEPAADMPAPFNAVPNPFTSFMRRVRQKVNENAKDTGKVSLWNAVTDIAEEDFAPLMKVANAGLTAAYLKPMVSFEAFDAFVYAFGKGIESATGKKYEEPEEPPRDVPYGKLGMDYEIDYAKQVGTRLLSAPAATIFSVGNYPYRMLRAAGFREGFAAEAEAMAAIVGMKYAHKALNKALITDLTRLRDWADSRANVKNWEKTSENKVVTGSFRKWAKESLKIEDADTMEFGALVDLAQKKSREQTLQVEEQQKKEAQDAFDAVAKAEETKRAEPEKQAEAPVEEAKQEVPVAEKVRSDAEPVPEGGDATQEGKKEGSPDKQRDQAGERARAAQGEKREPEEVAGEISEAAPGNTVFYHRTSAASAAKIMDTGLSGAHSIDTTASIEGSDAGRRKASLLLSHKGNDAVVVIEVPFSGRAHEIVENVAEYNVSTTGDPSLLHKAHIKGWYDLTNKVFYKNPDFNPKKIIKGEAVEQAPEQRQEKVTEPVARKEEIVTPEAQAPVEEPVGTPLEEVQREVTAINKPPAPPADALRSPVKWIKDKLGKMEMERSNSYFVKREDLTYDPAKMQFRSNVDAEGVTGSLGDVKRYSQILAGAVHVWRDPASGKLYIINGHHRYERARATGEAEIEVTEIRGMKNFAEARVAGALINIGQGQGNVLAEDVAKLFRNVFGDSDADGRLTGKAGKRLSKICEESGLSMRTKAVQQGVKLARLDEAIFKDYLNKDITEEAAITISDVFPDDPNRQNFLYRLVRDRMNKKKTDEYPSRYEIESLANQIVNNAIRVVKKRTLLGEEDVVEWDVDPNIRTDLETMVRERLSNTFKDAGRISNEQNARIMKLLGEDPATIPTEKANELRTVAGAVREIFNKTVKQKGEIDDLIVRFTNEITADIRETDGKNRHRLTEQFYRETVEALQRAYGGGEGKNVRLFSDDTAAGEAGEAPRAIDPNQRSLFARHIPGEGSESRPPEPAARTVAPDITGEPAEVGRVELPETFKIIKNIVRSVWPDLAMSRFLRFAESLPGNAFGMFKQTAKRGERATSTITLKEELLEANTSLNRVLAHEGLGHFLQFFIREKPQLDPKDKGGAEDMLLDIANAYQLPGGKAPWEDPTRISDAELNTLRGAAEELMTERNKFGNVYGEFRGWENGFRKRTIFKNLAEEVRKFWDEVRPEDRVELYNAVLRGIDAPYFDLARLRTEKPEAAEIFDRIVRDQIVRQHEMQKSPMYQELKDVSKAFTPFDEALDQEYTAYRYNAGELWADFMSAVLTNPDLVKRVAPRLFLDWYEWVRAEKPEFYETWFKFAGLEGDVEKHKSRLLDIREDYDSSQNAEIFEFLKKYDERIRGDMSTAAQIARVFVDRNAFVWEKLKENYLKDRANPNKNPMHALAPIEYAVKSMSYLDSVAFPYVAHLFNKFKRTFGDAWVNDKVSLNLAELNDFMRLIRVSEERYYKKVTTVDPETGEATTEVVERVIPESGLVQRKYAQETLEVLKQKFGEKKTEYYIDLFNTWQDLRQQYVIPALERSQAWAEDAAFLRKARENVAYGKFESLDVINEINSMYGIDVSAEMFGGTTSLNSMLKGRKGNVGSVRDVPSATFEQDIQILRMARRSELRRMFVDEMYKYAPDRLSAGLNRYPDWKKLTIHRGGEKIDVWMDPRFYDAVVQPDATFAGVERFLNALNYPFKSAFVKYNLAFSVFNTVRDYNSSAIKLPMARRFFDAPWAIMQMMPPNVRRMLMDKTGIRFDRSLAKYFLPAARKAFQEERFLAGKTAEMPAEIDAMELAGAVSPANSWQSMVGIFELGDYANKIYAKIKDKEKFQTELNRIRDGEVSWRDADIPKAMKEYFGKAESLQRNFDQYNLWLENDPGKFEQEVVQPVNGLINGVARDTWELMKTAFRQIPKLAKMSDRINKIVGYEYLLEHAGDIWRDVTPAEREALLWNAVRERAGSPDFRQKGLAYAFYNNLFIFSNAGIQGLSSTYSAFRDNPKDTAWKYLMYNIGPKVLLYSLYQGAIPFSFTDPISGTEFNQDDLKAALQKIPSYQLSRYRIIPIAVYGQDPELFYATLPSSFEGETLNTLIWAGLEAGGMEALGLPGTGTGTVQNVNKALMAASPFASEAPVLSSLKDFAEYFQYGTNPVNSFTGKGRIPYTDYADGRAALHNGNSLKWAWASRWIAYDMLNSLTGGFVYRPADFIEYAVDKASGDPAQELKLDMLNSLKRFGVSFGPAFGRIFRSTNSGEKQMVAENAIKEENEAFVRRNEARKIVDAKLDELPKIKGRFPRISESWLRRTSKELAEKNLAYGRESDLKEHVRNSLYATSNVPILMDVAKAKSKKGIVDRLKKIHPDTTEKNYQRKLRQIELQVFGYDLP